MTEIAFFVTGMGRSGTLWLAKLLDQSPGIRCYHEPRKVTPWDVRNYGRMYKDRDFARTYLEARREAMVHGDRFKWSEVNSFLRYCAPELREVFDVPVAAIVRDGKFTVRSLLNRGIGHNPRRMPMQPPPEFKEPFDCACWYWADAYRRLIDERVSIYRLEDLNDDYDEVCRMCSYLGVRPVEKQIWRARFSRKPQHWAIKDPDLGWTEEEHQRFYEVAGDVQEMFDYE